MKPIGMITYCYEFISPETKRSLEELIKTSKNYHDFGTRLALKAASEDVSAELAYLTFRHLPPMTTNTSLLLKKYGSIPAIKPWTIQITTIGEHLERKGAVLQSIRVALDTNLPDWIAMELLLLQARMHLIPGIEPDLSNAISEAESFFHQRLEGKVTIYEARLHGIKAYGMHASETEAERLKEWENAIHLAKRAGDIAFAVNMLSRLGNRIKGLDASLALTLLSEASELSRMLGSPHIMIEPLNCTGLVATLMGEYDLAIDFFMESLKLKKAMGSPLHELVLNLANVCNNLCMFKEGLTWASEAPHNPYARVHMARALIGLGKLDEVSEHLDFAKKVLLKGGSRTEIVDYGYGLYYFTKGDLDLAYETLARAAERIDEKEGWIHTSSVYIALVKIELAAQDTATCDHNAEFSGPWMNRLFTYAEQKGLTGILFEALLLKAKLRVVQERVQDAKTLIEQALEISDQASMRSFHSMALQMMREVA